jgi:uncharacterized repeat protein (TIGR01451 family)
MKHSINLTIYILFVANQLFAQSTSWMSRSENLFPTHLCTDDSGNIYQSGYFEDPTVKIGNTTLLLQGTQNAVIAKYDSYGNPIWVKNLEDGQLNNFSAYHQIYSSIITTQQELWVLGQFQGAMFTGNFSLNSQVNSNFFLLKLDPISGNVLAADTGSIASYTEGLELTMDKVGDIYMTGYSNDDLSFKGVFLPIPQGGGFVYKMDNVGNLKWGIGIENGKIKGTIVNSNYDLFISGEADTNLKIAGVPITQPIASSLMNHFIAKIDSSGNLCWVRFIDAQGRISVSATDTSGNVYYLGEYVNFAVINGQQFSSITNTQEVLFGKIDSSGNFCWVKNITGTGNSRANSLKSRKDGKLILCGGFDNDLSIGSHYLQGISGMYLAIFDTSGTCTFSQQSQDPGYCSIQYAIPYKSEEIIFTTHHRRNNFPGTFSIANNVLPFQNSLELEGGVIGRLLLKGNRISGTVFIDYNNNGIKETGEHGVSNLKVISQPSGGAGNTNNLGEFSVHADSGNYTLSINNLPSYYTLSGTQNISGYFSGYYNIDTGKSIGLYSAPGNHNLKIELTPLNFARAGNNFAISIYYQNLSSQSENFDIIVENYNQFSVNTTQPLADTISGNRAVWKINNILPFESGIRKLTYTIPTSAQIGDTIILFATVRNFQNDVDTTDNTDTDTSFVSGPYDPNFKVVTQNNLTPQEVSLAPWLQYTIHFQNLGNDTAFKVVIIDTLSQNLNPQTLQVVASSYPVTYEIDVLGVTTFTFDNIQLPDSGVDLTGSCGYVKYRIKPDPSLQSGDLIMNFADIYFDFAKPVRTDTAYTSISWPLNLSSTINTAPNKPLPKPD